MPVQYILQAPTLADYKTSFPFHGRSGEQPVLRMADVNLKFTKPRHVL